MGMVIHLRAKGLYTPIASTWRRARTCPPHSVTARTPTRCPGLGRSPRPHWDGGDGSCTGTRSSCRRPQLGQLSPPHAPPQKRRADDQRQVHDDGGHSTHCKVHDVGVRVRIGRWRRGGRGGAARVAHGKDCQVGFWHHCAKLRCYSCACPCPFCAARIVSHTLPLSLSYTDTLGPISISVCVSLSHTNAHTHTLSLNGHTCGRCTYSRAG